MESQDNSDDFLDDPIQLNIGVKASQMANIHFLDPGIIDLDCDSDDDDCKYIDEDSDINLLGRTATLPPVITTISHHVKPMSIKIIDCYKFPWFFDQPTRNIIENKLLINNSVNMKQAPNGCPKELKNVSIICNVDSNSLLNVNNNNIGGRVMSVDIIKSINEADTCANKTIALKPVDGVFNSNFRVCERKKRVVNSQKRNDMEKLRAISQRNNLEVDLKKNKGLVGMKVQRIMNEKQTVRIKNKAKKQTKNNIEKREQDTLSKLYVQAIDDALLNLGTTITPVFADATGNSKESEGRTSQDVNVTVNPIKNTSITSNFIPATLEKDISRKKIKDRIAQKDNDEKDMASKINENTKIAKKIVRMVISNIEEKNSNKEKDKPDNKNKKIENERKKILMDGIQKSLKQQKNTDGCKMTKMIMPIPLSSKARKKKKLKNSIKQQTFVNICKTKEPAKQESENLKLKKDTLTNSASPSHNSNKCTPKKTFTTLNKFTEDILNKIQAKQLQQFKTNKHEKLHKKRAKKINYIDLSTSDCKLIANETDTKANTPKNLILDDEKVNNLAKETSLKMSETQLHHLNNPDYLQYESYTDKYLQFLHHNVNNTLPLEKIIIKTAEADVIKIDEIASGTLIENTHYNTPKPENPVNESYVDSEHISIINTSTNVVSLGTKNNENCMLNERNINKMPILVELPPERTNTQPVINIIETIISNRNESDIAKHNSTHPASNSFVHTHTKKPQSSEIKIKPTHQARAKNSPLYIPNWQNQMFLNSPEAIRQYQTAAQQMNQSVHEPVWYSHAHAAVNARSTIGVAEDIPASLVSNTISPSRGIGRVSPQAARNLRAQECISTQMTLNAGSVPSGYNRPISPPMGINAKPLGNNRGTPPYRHMNNTQHSTQTGVKGAVSQQMWVNTKPIGVNGGILSSAGGYGDISRHKTMREKPTPPEICDKQLDKVFWSYAFPPPKPPPPPPFLPLTQKITGSPCTSQTNSSIIGINNDGIIKKINIAAPVPVGDYSTKEGNAKVDNQEPVFTSLYDEVFTGLKSSTPATTKSETLRMLGSMQQIQSPYRHLEGNSSIVSSQSPASPIDLTNSLHPQSNEKPAANMPKPELSQEPKLKIVTTTNWKVPSPFEFDSNVKNNKRTYPIEPCGPNMYVKYKPGPLSKKMKFNDPRTRDKTLPSKGYSASILPIPTYEKMISDIPSYYNNYDKPVEQNKMPIPDTKTKKFRPTKRYSQLEQTSNSFDISKKISLNEYKKRSASVKKTDEETNIYNSQQKEKVKTKTVDMPRRESYVDSDLGYDSDSTVKL